MAPLFLSFFCLAMPTCAAEGRDTLDDARLVQLSSDPTWHALLHYVNGECLVKDARFLLNADQCSPERELAVLLETLLTGPIEAVRDISCRFPARLEFLRQRLSASRLAMPREECKELTEYKQKAPAETISLVFAAENITHPMSMMGHVFLKFQGINSTGQEVAHAATFFTQISSVNVPSLILDSLILGMPSHFALIPYFEQLVGYRDKEQRNVWEYPIVATTDQKELIHLHVWELRTIKTPYLFVGYNCATVVYLLVSLAKPEMLVDLGRWVTPIDVARHANDSSILGQRVFLPSVDWQAKSYAKELGEDNSLRVLSALSYGSQEDIIELAADSLGGLEVAFASNFWERKVRLGTAEADRLELVTQALIDARNRRVGDQILVDNLLDPLSGPKSSRISVGAVHLDGINYARFELLPASHTLSDDNRRSYSESSLELAQLSILVDPSTGRPNIEEATIYGLESLVPYDRYIGGISSRLGIGIERQWDQRLSPFTAGHITVGIGQTLPLGEDARLYTLMNVAGSYGDDHGTISYFPEFGGLLYEVFAMKTIANYRLVCGQHDATRCYQQGSVTQSFFPNKDLSPYLKSDFLWNRDQGAQVFEIGLKWYF